jgi:hypothetical protein
LNPLVSVNLAWLCALAMPALLVSMGRLDR